MLEDVPTDAVVLAGGAGTRFAAQRPGADKLTVDLCDLPLIGHVLTGLQHCRRIFLVGHPTAATSPPPDRVVGVVEDPPGRGPLPAAAAGLRRAETDVVALLGGDQPFAAAALPRLTAAVRAADDVDAALGVDPGGRLQPLLSVVRRAPAVAVLDALAARGDLLDRPLMALFRALPGRVVHVPVSARESLDVDVPADLDAAAALLAGAPEPPAT